MISSSDILFDLDLLLVSMVEAGSGVEDTSIVDVSSCEGSCGLTIGKL